jgi:hypothetical protein
MAADLDGPSVSGSPRSAASDASDIDEEWTLSGLDHTVSVALGVDAGGSVSLRFEPLVASTDLHRCAFNNDVRRLEDLVKVGGGGGAAGMRPRACAWRAGLSGGAQERKYALDYKDPHGQSALMLATQLGHYHCVKVRAPTWSALMPCAALLCAGSAEGRCVDLDAEQQWLGGAPRGRQPGRPPPHPPAAAVLQGQVRHTPHASNGCPCVPAGHARRLARPRRIRAGGALLRVMVARSVRGPTRPCARRASLLADREAPVLLRKIATIGDFYIAIKWKFSRRVPLLPARPPSPALSC